MKKILSLLVFSVVVLSCSSNGDDKTGGSNYDRTAMLTNWADNIIIPGYENYQAKVQVLLNSTETFVNEPIEGNLLTLRNSWLEAYKAYQHITIYNIGKAEAISLKECTNAYPTDVTGIEANISSGSYNLNLLSQYTKQGFPAFDYLINGLGDKSDTAILEFYTTHANALNYKEYLMAVVNRLKTNADAIVTDWNSGYRNEFIANSGTSAGSAVSMLVNDFVLNFERDIRSGKVGIPAGVFSAGQKFPGKTEAFYKNDVSKELLNISVKAVQDFFNGKHFNSDTTGPGLNAYLDYVNAVRDGQKLSDIINRQFTAIFEANANLDNSFSDQVNSDNSKMLLSFEELQQQVVYTKLDMMQALNISVDYVDSDGD